MYFLRLQFQQIPNLSSPFLGFLICFTARLKLNPVLLKRLTPRPLQGKNHFSKQCLAIIEKEAISLFYKNEIFFFPFPGVLPQIAFEGLVQKFQVQFIVLLIKN